MGYEQLFWDSSYRFLTFFLVAAGRRGGIPAWHCPPVPVTSPAPLTLPSRDMCNSHNAIPGGLPTLCQMLQILLFCPFFTTPCFFIFF